MAGKGAGSPDKLSDQIDTMKYTMLFFNLFVWMMAASIFGLSMWLRFEPGLHEWIIHLEINSFYAGLYVLIVFSIIMMISSFVGCFSSFAESEFFIMIFIITQALCFVGGLSGAAVLLDYSTQQSSIQPMIRESMRKLIMNPLHEESRKTLEVIQENIGCCGADGAIDYSSLNQPLPPQCRDTVTGNPFFHGCVDELTWFFEEKTGWLSGLVLTVCMMNVLNIVVATVMTLAIRKDNNYSTNYRN